MLSRKNRQQPDHQITPMKNNTVTKNAIQREKQSFVDFFKAIKKQIGSDTLVETGDGEKPGIEVTIGFRYDKESDELEWNYQTGDNSYMGAAYSFAHWATTTVMKRSNCNELANDICEQMENLPWEE